MPKIIDSYERCVTKIYKLKNLSSKMSLWLMGINKLLGAQVLIYLW